MAAVIPGLSGPQQPNVFTRVRTRERVPFVSGGQRVVAIIGEGETEEILVQSARGGGRDGLSPTFSTSGIPDGRHFQISALDLVENRARILKNGIPLRVLEGNIDSSRFDARFDVRVEPLTGRVELQRAYLVDFGTDGSGNTLYFSTNQNNQGNGGVSITQTSLVNANSPAETWTARVVNVIRDGYGNTIPGLATFSVAGSESGVVTDGNGAPFVWRSDGVFVNNGILNIAFTEGATPFAVGDRFTIQVDSGVLSPNDSLEARYIVSANLNDPTAFFSAQDAFEVFGQPSETNTTSLGIQMAFENGAPLVVGMQAKPPVPKRTSLFMINPDNPLTDAVEGASDGYEIKDTIFPFPVFSKPDIDSKVNIFVVNSDGSEEQVLLNKEDFYDPALTTVAGAYSDFVLGPLGTSYTVFTAPQVEQSGDDGYVLVNSSTEITFSAPSASFAADRVEAGEGDIGKQLVILAPEAIAGTYDIDDVGDGYGNMTIAIASDGGATLTPATAESDVVWQVVDQNDTEHAYLAITDDFASNYLTAGKGLRITYIDDRDFGFFDTNWGEALEALEKVDVQILCPLPRQTISNIFQAFKRHVEVQSNIENQNERIVVVGAIEGMTADAVLGNQLVAVEDIGILEGIQGDDPEEILAGNIEDLADYSVPRSFGDSFRCIFVYPDQIVRNIAGQNTLLSGYFMSPAVGGFLAGEPNVAIPATFKTLAGFNILRSRVLRRFTKNQLAGAGVLVVEPIAGGGRMLHGLTTTQSRAPEEEEISIIAIRDQVARTLRASLRPFVGKLQSPTLIPELNAGIGKLMRALVGQGLLSGFGAISVRRNEIEPRQLDIGIEINPVGPVNWIFIDTVVEL